MSSSPTTASSPAPGSLDQPGERHVTPPQRTADAERRFGVGLASGHLRAPLPQLLCCSSPQATPRCDGLGFSFPFSFSNASTAHAPIQPTMVPNDSFSFSRGGGAGASTPTNARAALGRDAQGGRGRQVPVRGLLQYLPSALAALSLVMCAPHLVQVEYASSSRQLKERV